MYAVAKSISLINVSLVILHLDIWQLDSHAEAPLLIRQLEKAKPIVVQRHYEHEHGEHPVTMDWHMQIPSRIHDSYYVISRYTVVLLCKIEDASNR